MPGSMLSRRIGWSAVGFAVVVVSLVAPYNRESSCTERVAGIEPAPQTWKVRVRPLHHTRLWKPPPERAIPVAVLTNDIALRRLGEYPRLRPKPRVCYLKSLRRGIPMIELHHEGRESATTVQTWSIAKRKQVVAPWESPPTLVAAPLRYSDIAFAPPL